MDRRRDGRRERAEGEPRRGKGVVYAYEAYEAKKKGEKLRCLLLRRKKKNIIILFMM
jgi:hypothetical protein